MEQTRAEGFGAEVKRRIMLGTYALSAGYYDAYYLKAQKVRTLINREFEAAFAKYDVIVTPTSPTVAFPIGAKVDDPYAMYLNDVYTLPASVAGLPALSLPCGESEGLPVGLQIIGNFFDEPRIIQAAARLRTGAGLVQSRGAALDRSRRTAADQRHQHDGNDPRHGANDSAFPERVACANFVTVRRNRPDANRDGDACGGKEATHGESQHRKPPGSHHACQERNRSEEEKDQRPPAEGDPREHRDEPASLRSPLRRPRPLPSFGKRKPPRRYP